MDFELSDEQVALRDELRRVLAASCNGDARRAAIAQPGAVDRSLWRTLADLGVFTLCLPARPGGVGLGRAGATVVFEELGRALVPGPTIATFLAAGIVPGSEDGPAVVEIVEQTTPLFVEHLDGLDHLLILDSDSVVLVDPRSIRARAIDRPLDPLTPAHLVDTIGDATPLAANGPEWRRD